MTTDAPTAAAPTRLRRVWLPRLLALVLGGGIAAALYVPARSWLASRETATEKAAIETRNQTIEESRSDLFKPSSGPPYALRPKIHAGARLETDSLGLRSPELAEEKKLKRILVLGDSFAYGFGLKEGEPFSHVLSRRLLGVAEVANAAVSGYQIQDIAAQYLRVAGAVKPDLVIVTFVNNDLNDSEDIDEKGNVTGMPLSRLPDGCYAGDANLQRIGYASWLRGVDLTRFMRVQYAGNEWLWRSVGPFARGRWKRYEAELARIRDDAKARGARVVMFSFYPRQLGLLEACAHLDVPYFDLADTLDIGAKKNQLEWDAHPNAASNRHFAERILRAIAWTKVVAVPGVEPLEPETLTPELAATLERESEKYARTELASWIAFDTGAKPGRLGQLVGGIEDRNGLLGARAVALLFSPKKDPKLRIQATAQGCAPPRTLEVRLGGVDAATPFELTGARSQIVIDVPDAALERIEGGCIVEVDVRDPAVAGAPPAEKRKACCARMVRLELE